MGEYMTQTESKGCCKNTTVTILTNQILINIKLHFDLAITATVNNNNNKMHMENMHCD